MRCSLGLPCGPVAHPETALEIPRAIITAKKMATKEKLAKELLFVGPLTLRQAVEQGYLTRENAIRSAMHWAEHGGDVAKAKAMVEGI